MTGEEIFTAATRQGLVVSTGILGDLVPPAGTFDPGHADEIGPEGPTVRNRTVAYFLPALSWCRFPSGGRALKGQVQDQHGDWKRLLVRFGGHHGLFPNSASHGGSANGVCISRIVIPAIGARLLRERWMLTGTKPGKSHMPAMISRIVAVEFSFRWPVYRFAQVGGEFWPKIRFLPYDSARLGLPPQIRELAAQAAVYATRARGPGTLRVKRHPNLGHELERLKLLIF